MWTVWNKAKGTKLEMPKLMGQWQYIYTVGKKRISMIQIYGYPLDKMDNPNSYQWEILGYGMNDVERFDKKNDAEARVWELLLTPRGEEMP